MAQNPILYVTNPDHLRKERVTPVGGGRKDFYATKDPEFAAHKEQLLGQVEDAATRVEEQAPRFGESSFLKVTLRQDAWAKSNRPTSFLFPRELTPMVGASDIGELIVQVNLIALKQVQGKVISAEPETRWKKDRKTGRDKPNPTPARSEVGAVREVAVWSSSDRAPPTVDDALAYFQSTGLAAIYSLDLFIPTTEYQLRDDGSRVIVESGEPVVLNFLSGLRSLSRRMSIIVFSETSRRSGLITVQVGIGSAASGFHFVKNRRDVETYKDRYFTENHLVPSEHRELLGFISQHPLVRTIRLPKLFASDPASFSKSVTHSRLPRSSSASGTSQVALPSPRDSRTYPRIGIVDGGVSAIFDEWIVYRKSPIPDRYLDFSHGTAIAGLVVAGSVLNPDQKDWIEDDGCWIADLSLQPNEHTCPPQHAWKDGTTQFLTALESMVRECKKDHGIRIYNFSLNTKTAVNNRDFSEEAKRLDEIARAHDVVFVISAGNAEGLDERTEWDRRPTRVLQDLATRRNDGIFSPAESLSNISVAALNPPAIKHAIPEAPSSYSRQGPGVRGTVKPDVAHFGGVGGSLPSAMQSVDENGLAVQVVGTSFAAPLVAKALATLDLVTNGKASREVLMALLLHGAQVRAPLTRKMLTPVARNLVGFGTAPRSSKILELDPYTFGVVIEDQIFTGRNCIVEFLWPQSLVNADGSCRGSVKLTLLYTPPVDYRFGAEANQISLDVTLQQAVVVEEDADTGEDEEAVGTTRWRGRLKPVHSQGLSGPVAEKKLILDGLKWGPVKVMAKELDGVGESSNWRVKVNYVARDQVELPTDGVPFAAILTIADPDESAPVYDEMRRQLGAAGIKMRDILLALRARV